MTQPNESDALTPPTFALLERLASAPGGITAAELQRELGLDGRPSNRLNVLARKGYAHVDTHNQRWAILHAGFERVAAELAPERVGELVGLWPVACDCVECASSRGCACRQCVEYRAASA